MSPWARGLLVLLFPSIAGGVVLSWGLFPVSLGVFIPLELKTGVLFIIFLRARALIFGAPRQRKTRGKAWGLWWFRGM